MSVSDSSIFNLGHEAGENAGHLIPKCPRALCLRGPQALAALSQGLCCTGEVIRQWHRVDSSSVCLDGAGTVGMRWHPWHM